MKENKNYFELEAGLSYRGFELINLKRQVNFCFIARHLPVTQKRILSPNEGPFRT